MLVRICLPLNLQHSIWHHLSIVAIFIQYTGVHLLHESSQILLKKCSACEIVWLLTEMSATV